MTHFGSAALRRWDTAEYAAGYRARFSDIQDSEAAHHCWRCGWEDVDTEALESARHKKALVEGKPDHFEDTWGNLFDTGEEARVNGIPFDPERTDPWKEGSVEVDIRFGMLAEQGHV